MTSLPLDDVERLHVYRNHVTDWFVARSPEDAVKMAREYYAECLTEAQKDWLDFEQEPDDKAITCHTDDGEVTRTCAEWAAENGPGFLFSTEF